MGILYSLPLPTPKAPTLDYKIFTLPHGNIFIIVTVTTAAAGSSMVRCPTLYPGMVV